MNRFVRDGSEDLVSGVEVRSSREVKEVWEGSRSWWCPPEEGDAAFACF